jgi:hypothetical protein
MSEFDSGGKELTFVRYSPKEGYVSGFRDYTRDAGEFYGEEERVGLAEVGGVC